MYSTFVSTRTATKNTFPMHQQIADLPRSAGHVPMQQDGFRPEHAAAMFVRMPYVASMIVQQGVPSSSQFAPTTSSLVLAQNLQMELSRVYNNMMKTQQYQPAQQHVNSTQPINMLKRPLRARNSMLSPSTPEHQLSDLLHKQARLDLMDMPKRRSYTDETDSWSSSGHGDIVNGDAELTFTAKRSEPGERRLHIQFLNYGRKGDAPQFHGKFRFIIPDGLHGMLTLYNEDWETELRHHAPVRFHPNVVRIEWTVVSLATMERVSVIETENEAILRQTAGRTIANNVFKKALDARVEFLNARFTEEKNGLKRANLESMIRLLSPLRFTQGPLAFGLLHRSIQERFLHEHESS